MTTDGEQLMSDFLFLALVTACFLAGVWLGWFVGMCLIRDGANGRKR